MTLTVTPLSDALGAEVEGVDLSAPFDDATADAVRGAWLEHQVLLFRDQDLTSQQQIGFCAYFGEVQDQVSRFQGDMNAEHPAVLYVSNVREDAILPDGEMWFHSDQCYYEVPTNATCLHAIELPSVGGNTLFADTYGAYETLPDDIKRRLAGRRGMNVYDYWVNACLRQGESRPEAPRWSHPLVRTHPLTRRRSLYICRLMTEYIEGIERDESDRLLGYLFDHMEDRSLIYEHRWRVGDVVIWDNRCTVHARTDFDPAESRLLRRVAVEGEVPS